MFSHRFSKVFQFSFVMLRPVRKTIVFPITWDARRCKKRFPGFALKADRFFGPFARAHFGTCSAKFRSAPRKSLRNACGFKLRRRSKQSLDRSQRNCFKFKAGRGAGRRTGDRFFGCSRRRRCQHVNVWLLLVSKARRPTRDAPEGPGLQVRTRWPSTGNRYLKFILAK